MMIGAWKAAREESPKLSNIKGYGSKGSSDINQKVLVKIHMAMNAKNSPIKDHEPPKAATESATL
jgi:hypothetical protein